MKDIIQYGGGGLLKEKYSNSVFKLISTIYSNQEWHPWKFAQIPQGYWDELSNQKKFLDWLGKMYYYTTFTIDRFEIRIQKSRRLVFCHEERIYHAWRWWTF